MTDWWQIFNILRLFVLVYKYDSSYEKRFGWTLHILEDNDEPVNSVVVIESLSGFAGF